MLLVRRGYRYPSHFLEYESFIIRIRMYEFPFWMSFLRCLPLSSLFRFFFNEMVTSVLMTGASLTRSLAFSVAAFDMIGADTGRAIELVDVKSEKHQKIRHEIQNLAH